jgi:hypothetical protein
MLVERDQLLYGDRRTGASVNIPSAGNANALSVLTQSTFASMVGNKTFILKRIMIRNNGAGNTYVHFGTGAAGAVVDMIPPIYSLANTTDNYAENEVTSLEILGNIMCYVDAVGGGSFDVQVEAEECG